MDKRKGGKRTAITWLDGRRRLITYGGYKKRYMEIATAPETQKDHFIETITNQLLEDD